MSIDGKSSFIVGGWRADPQRCRLTRDGAVESVEPKVMDLLVLLAGRTGDVISREDLFDRLWPGVTVGEDTLARAISKLRRALGDDPKQPRYVETIPKRGYRLIAEVEQDGASDALAPPSERPGVPAAALIAAGIACVLIVAASAYFFTRGPAVEASTAEKLTARGDDFYMRFTRADNEAAIELYERAISEQPSYSPAQAGLANALVQRVIRWQTRPGEDPSASSLSDALSKGLTETPQARDLLSRAEALAERSVRLSRDSGSLKALGFVYAAQGELDRAAQAYEKALEKDENAWAPLINLGEISQIRGEQRKAIDYYERAYRAMGRVYESEPHHVGPWHAPLGVLIGDLHAKTGEPQEAEIWYRRVLALSPFDPEATVKLARLLTRGGDPMEGRRLCAELIERLGEDTACAGLREETR